MAKQVPVSMFTYHGTFILVPADILRQLCTSVYTFVAANRPAAAGAAPLFPSRAISTRRLQQGGIALVDIPAQLTALQAKTIGRLLEPEPWKAHFSSWLGMPLTGEQRITAPAQSQHLWQLGRGLPFSSFPTQSIQAPRRVVACLKAFRQLRPHRIVSPEHMPHQEVIGQPLFHSRQITHLKEPIAWDYLARLDRTTVEHLRDLFRSGAAQPAQQQEMALLLDAMPASRAAHIYGPSPQPTHLTSANPADQRVFCPAADGQLTYAHSIQHCGAAAAGTASSAHGGPGPASRPQASAGHFFFFFKWRRLTFPSIIANRKRLSNPDRQIKQTTGDRWVHSTSYDKESCSSRA